MKLLITSCYDSLMWYANKVGQKVDFVRKISEGYLSREPSGLTNIVLEKDARIIK